MILFLVFNLVTSSAVQAGTSVKLSPNVPAVQDCLPKLSIDELQKKFELNLLKSKIDDLYVTSSSFLRMRIVTLKDADGAVKKLRLTSEKLGPAKFQYVLSFQRMDAKGAVVDLPVAPKHRINPLTQEFNSYLVNEEVLSDEYSYLDTKLNAATMSYKKDGLEVIELEFTEPTLAKVLSCERKENLGVICECSKKSK